MARCIGTSTLDTPSDTYLYSLTKTGNAFATIGSDDSLRLFDPSLKLLHNSSAAHKGISCLSSFGDGLMTAGRDGVIRSWDLRLKRNSIEISEPKGNGFSSISHHEHIIAAGTESAKEGLGDVSVLLYDTRNASTPLRTYAESHTDTITQLAFHPTQSHLVMSGSTDGLVSVFDINQADEEDALQQVLNPRSAVHCCGFISPTEVYVATTDEQLYIYPLGDDDTRSTIEIGDVREKLDCMYIVDVITNGTTPMMAYGHNVNEKLSVVQLAAESLYSFGSVVEFPRAHGDEVVRDVLVLEREKKVLSCGEDGRVKVWDLAAV